MAPHDHDRDPIDGPAPLELRPFPAPPARRAAARVPVIRHAAEAVDRVADWSVTMSPWWPRVGAYGGGVAAGLTSGTTPANTVLIAAAVTVGAMFVFQGVNILGAVWLAWRGHVPGEPLTRPTPNLDAAAWWDAQGAPATAAVYRQLAYDAGEVREPEPEPAPEPAAPVWRSRVKEPPPARELHSVGDCIERMRELRDAMGHIADLDDPHSAQENGRFDTFHAEFAAVIERMREIGDDHRAGGGVAACPNCPGRVSTGDGEAWSYPGGHVTRHWQANQLRQECTAPDGTRKTITFIYTTHGVATRVHGDDGCTCATIPGRDGEPIRILTLGAPPCPVHDRRQRCVRITDPDTGELLGWVHGAGGGDDFRLFGTDDHGPEECGR